MIVWLQRRQFTEPELVAAEKRMLPYTEFWSDGFWADREWIAMTTVTDWDRVPLRQQTTVQLMLDPAVESWNHQLTVGAAKTQINYWNRQLAARADPSFRYRSETYWTRLEQIRDLWAVHLMKKVLG